MTQILQVLVFCTPFYDFLDKVANKAAHAFKSNTPLIDALLVLYTLSFSANESKDHVHARIPNH